MNKIGIIDAELLFKSAFTELGKHRFPNLASMKISGYHKTQGDTVTLITQLPNPVQKLYKLYDKIYISKVFVETSVPTELLRLSNVIYGGTGFFYANAQPLPYEIENHIPDYHLYDEWIKERKSLKSSTDEFSYYEDYSLGFTSRGCIRQCKFCINQHCTKVQKASSIKEFLDEDRNYICLLDDNILAYEGWKEVFNELNSTGKTFEFKQGLDIRALTKEKAEVISNSKININTLYFAFDSIKDKNIIEEKLELWRQYYKKNCHMYVLCGFDENNKYDEEFWARDIVNTLERIRICIKYGVFPYIMRFRMYNTALNPYKGMYINLSAWCNQKTLFSKWSFNEWADNIQKGNEKQLKKKRLYSSKRYLLEYAGKFPDVAYEYFDLKYNNIEHNQYIYEKEDTNILSVRSSKILNIDKTKKQEEIKKVKKDLTIQEHTIQINQNKIQNDIISNFKSPLQLFKNGVVVRFNGNGIKSIPKNSVNLLLINCKNETLDECEQILLIASENYLKNNGELYIYNTDLKSFTFTKEFVETNTNLKFKEVATFKSINPKSLTNRVKVQYCSRYTLENKLNIFETNNFETRTTMFKNIIKQSTKKDDIILSFFESHNYFEKIGEDYYKRNWICFKKRMLKDTNMALKELNKEFKTSPISLLAT